MHLVDKHSFPAYYDFLVVDTGIDNRSSMLRTRHRQTSSAASWGRRREQRQVKTSEDHLADAPSDQGDSDSRPTLNSLERKSDSISSYGQENEIGEIVSNLSALKLVPPSVRFGRGGGRGGLSRR